MKRFWLILLSLGLVMAFSVSAFAVDVKVSGEYFVGGLYVDKVDLMKANPYESHANISSAFFYQRLRVGTDFIVSPCLKLVTSFDAMERIWGGARSNTWQSNQADETNFSAGTRAESENIVFNQVYLEYTSPIGLFKVGYLPDYVFGTSFADQGNMLYDGQIQYFIQSGPFTGFLGYAKRVDSSYSSVTYNSWSNGVWYNSIVTDRDYDSYRVAGIYNFKGNNVHGEAGLLFLYDRDATNRGSYNGPYLTNVYALDPFVKAKIGPVALQAEALYYFGDARKWEGTRYGSPFNSALVGGNITINALSVFVDATVNLGPAYVGGTFAYLSGDKPDSSNVNGTGGTIEGGINTGGADWNPCLIMFNTETMGYWAGPVGTDAAGAIDNQMSNAWFFQGKVGVKPTPQWDIMMSLAYATADQKPLNYVGNTYGTEVDLTGTYKITNNLSYMLGAGYLFTGDYFKGVNSGGLNQVSDDFILINKLTLSF
ncbi:MAG: hypothetical protein ABSF13_06400 [Smithella sp.]|jgi:hypothetical protein